MVNIYGVDLNLILVFTTIYETENISRAAQLMGLSQPAVSCSLKRLRAITNDKLFTRLSKGVCPTVHAHHIYKKLSPAITLIREGLENKRMFKIKEYKKEYLVGVADWFIFTHFSTLLESIKKTAPFIKITPTLFSQSDFSKGLKDGEYDFVLATKRYTSNTTNLFNRFISRDEYCIIASKKHLSVKKTLSLKQYLNSSHIITSFEGKNEGEIDTILKKMGHSREVQLSVANFLTVPFLVASTQLLAGTSLQFAKSIQKSSNINIYPVPFKVPNLEHHMYWHNSFENDPAKEWILAKILEVCGQTKSHHINDKAA